MTSPGTCAGRDPAPWVPRSVPARRMPAVGVRSPPNGCSCPRSPRARGRDRGRRQRRACVARKPSQPSPAHLPAVLVVFWVAVPSRAVRKTGIEPARREAQEPKSCVSASSTTRAVLGRAGGHPHDLPRSSPILTSRRPGFAGRAAVRAAPSRRADAARPGRCHVPRTEQRGALTPGGARGAGCPCGRRWAGGVVRAPWRRGRAARPFPRTRPGRRRGQESMPRSLRSLATCPVARTLYWARATVPCSSRTTVERMSPRETLP